MREIKFRAWDVEKNIMIYHGLLCFYQHPKMAILGPQELQQRIYPFDGIESGEMCTGDVLNGWNLMQFTGLHDKNGKEIYEGDIIYVAGKGNCKVLFSHAAWAFENGKHLGFFNECEEELTVIGNIYENPNLYDTNYPNPS